MLILCVHVRLSSSLQGLAARHYCGPFFMSEARSLSRLLAASDYESDPFVSDRERDRAYFSDTFKVAGQPVEGHQVLTPRGGPRPPTPRGPHMDVTTSYPEGGNTFPGDRDRWYPREDTPFRVGGRPVEGHQVLRPPPPRRPTERGDHMRVTTSNPRFTRTDQPRRDDLYGDYRSRGSARGMYRSRDGVDDVEDRLMDEEEWDRSGSRRRYRSRSAREIDEYDEIPHFLADDNDVGLPLDREELFDRDDRTTARPRSGGRIRDFDRAPDPLFEIEDRDERMRRREWREEPPVESVREREWRDLEERRARRRPRLVRQDIQGLGSMPMQGAEWDDYRHPERRRPYERESTRRLGDLERRRYFGDDRYRREESRRYLDDERDYDRDEARRFDDDEGEYVRDGPHLVRRSWYNSRRPEEEDDYRRPYSDRPEPDRYNDRDRYYNDTRRSRYYSRNEEDRERMYEDIGRRDERGSVGGPMPEELLGVDSRYSSTRQKWTAGTSFDTV